MLDYILKYWYFKRHFNKITIILNKIFKWIQYTILSKWISNIKNSKMINYIAMIDARLWFLVKNWYGLYQEFLFKV